MELIKVTDKTRQQFIDLALQKARNYTKYKDWSYKNGLRPFLDFLGDVLENLNYQIDFISSELFISTTKIWKNLYNHAVTKGYRVQGRTSATAVLTFFLEEPATDDLIIPQNSRVDTKEGIPFYTVSSVTILKGTTSVTVEAINQESRATVELAETNTYTIELLPETVDGSVEVEMEGSYWDAVENFLYSYQKSPHFIQSLSESRNYQIRFGTGIKGMRPPIGEIINIRFAVTDGVYGNVPAETITEVQGNLGGSLGVQVFCTNLFKSSGGNNAETLESLRENLPIFNLTLERAVTPFDYRELGKRLPNVNSAKEFYNCGKFVQIVITPTSGGTATPALLEAVTNFYNDKKMVTTRVEAINAGIIEVELHIHLFVKPRKSRSTATNQAKSKLLDYMSSRPISDFLTHGNLYQLVENISEVNTSQIRLLKPKPFAFPIEGNYNELFWDVDLVETSKNQIYRLTYIASDRLLVTRGNAMANSSLLVGEEFADNNVKFTVNQNGTVGNKWEFKTYEINKDLDLRNVPAYPISYTNQIVITAEGEESRI